ncbi:hypothetical protein Peur_009519 [Populus x canadensis]
MTKKLKAYEIDPEVKVVVLKGNGKAFCAGGDVVASYIYMVAGHWSYGANTYKKKLILDYAVATYGKPVILMYASYWTLKVALIDGIVMGAGAGLSMHGAFKIVTENTVFAMPETAIGHFVDVGASHFLSRLPGFLGEYLGLTGTTIRGEGMVACGLATHFVLSKEIEAGNRADKWVLEAIKSMKAGSPISLKISLKSGIRAMFLDKDENPKWEPARLELVSDEMVGQYFSRVDEDDWESLQLPARSSSVDIMRPRL